MDNKAQTVQKRPFDME